MLVGAMVYSPLAFPSENYNHLLDYPLLSSYTQDPYTPAVGTAYMLLEHIGPETGQMLSATWAQHRHDPCSQTRLFNGMARIMLSLARLPQPHLQNNEPATRRIPPHL